MHALSLSLIDSYTFGSSISGGPTEPATVSFDVWWHSPTATEQLHNDEQGFAATLLDVTSGVSFSVESADFAFVSDPRRYEPIALCADRVRSQRGLLATRGRDGHANSLAGDRGRREHPLRAGSLSGVDSSRSGVECMPSKQFKVDD